MTDIQWAPGFDNEAGYTDALTNKAGENTTFASNVSYSIFVNAADGSVKAKGVGSFSYEMREVTFEEYERMRKTELGFSDDPDDISKEVTATAPNTYWTAYDDWNCECIHRPGVDATLSLDGRRFDRVRWEFKIVSAT